MIAKSLNKLIEINNPTMNNTPFHNVDTDEFPISHYIVNQTDKWPTLYEDISGYSFNSSQMLEWITKWGFTEVFTVDYTSVKKTTSNKVFAKLAINENEDTLATIIKFNPFTDTKKSSVEEDEYNESGITLYSNYSRSGYDIIKAELFKLLKKKPKKENNI